MVFKVCAEVGGLCARVSERDAHVTGDNGLLFLHTQLGGTPLEHNLEQDKSNEWRCAQMLSLVCLV